MSELYDVFNEETRTNKGKEYTPKIPKEEYAKKMQEWRNQLFSLANQQTLTAVESPQNYKTYLDLQSRLDYTVTNTLLVMAQYPDCLLYTSKSKEHRWYSVIYQHLRKIQNISSIWKRAKMVMKQKTFQNLRTSTMR